MQRQYNKDEEKHTEVHITLCPNNSIHIKIDNICLHLCRHDFLRLARTLREIERQIIARSPANGTRTGAGH